MAMLGDVGDEYAVYVGIEIDLHPCLPEIHQFLLGPRGAHMRPAREAMPFLEPAIGMALGDHDLSVPRPIDHAMWRKRRSQAQVVLLRRLFAQAGAAALAHLAREARPAALFPSQLAPAQAVLARDLLEHRLHVRAGCEGAEERLRVRVSGAPVDVPALQDSRRGAQAWQPDVAGIELAAQAMVVQRQQVLHEARFAQERPQLPRGLLDLDALDLARDADIIGRAVVAGEMRADAIAQVDAFADVDRQVVHAVEAIHARAFGQALERLGRKLRRQARDLEKALDRRRDLFGLAVAIERLD